MKSFKNHFSLIIALFSILFTVQSFMLIDRVIKKYEGVLHDNYSVIVVATEGITQDTFKKYDPIIAQSESISPDRVLNKLQDELKEQNIELLRLSLPKFYRIYFTHYPTPDELKTLEDRLLKKATISRVETFSDSHDSVYNLLQLFKYVANILAGTIFIITTLLIFKELKIWQLQHAERMQIMALFGAPMWLRSAVLFRLAILDAILAFTLVLASLTWLKTSGIVNDKLSHININIEVFNLVEDGGKLLIISIMLSIFLAFMVMIANKEEPLR